MRVQPATYESKSKKSNEQPTVKLEIKVKGDNGKPVADASVYVQYTVPGGFIHKEKLAKLRFFETEWRWFHKVLPVCRGRFDPSDCARLAHLRQMV